MADIDNLLDYDRSKYKWVASSIALVPAGSDGWIWLVTLTGEFTDSVDLAGGLPEIRIAVLMNGKAAETSTKGHLGLAK